MNKYDLTGKTFGYLTVLCRDETTIGARNSKWICKCKCGGSTVAAYGDLKSGHTTSCGCKKYESHNKRHGMSNTRIYRIWNQMKMRCYDKNRAAWKQYGGRGIEVCSEWKDSFESFYYWAMSNGYSDNLTIERVDVNGNYEPSNCKWISLEKQQANRTNTVLIADNGEFFTLRGLSEKYGIPQLTIKRRYDRAVSKHGRADLSELIFPVQINKTSFRYRK